MSAGQWSLMVFCERDALLLKLGAPSHIFSLRNGGKAETLKRMEKKNRTGPATTLYGVTA